MPGRSRMSGVVNTNERPLDRTSSLVYSLLEIEPKSCLTWLSEAQGITGKLELSFKVESFLR